MCKTSVVQLKEFIHLILSSLRGMNIRKTFILPRKYVCAIYTVSDLDMHITNMKNMLYFDDACVALEAY